jgi:bifunctional polynucleotide phosphatase/kinase
MKGSNTTSAKLFLIDVDGTLITSKSGQFAAQDEKDWVFLGDIAAKLEALHKEGWIVGLISNQSEWKKNPAIEGKFTSILNALGKANGWTPWCLLAITDPKDTVFRKPGRGLYDVLKAEINVPITETVMVGDAVGKDDPYPPYQWSDADRGFAAAIGATFQRPLDVFGTSPAVPRRDGKQELVILMGTPGSGKSRTGATFKEAGYVHVEQDVLANKAATLKAVVAALKTGNSVVVDATHGSEENRAPYKAAAAAAKIPYRILWHIRDGRPFNKLRPKKESGTAVAVAAGEHYQVPAVAYGVYTKYFVEPTDDSVELVY